MAKWGEGDPRWIVEERPDATNVNNWHWTEKNATPWSKEKLKGLLTGFELTQGELKVTVEEVSKLTGEATANNRKGKLIFFYEWDIQLKWKGRVNEGQKTASSGMVKIPNLSEENDLDEVELEVSVQEADSDSLVLKQFMYNVGRDKIRKQLGVYLTELKEEFSKGLILPKKDSGGAPTEAQKTTALNSLTTKFNNKINLDALNNDSKPKPTATPVGCKLDVASIDMSIEFNCQARELYDALTRPEMVTAFSRSLAQVNPIKGGEFALFNNNVTGKFEELEPNKSIRQSWRYKEWPAGHYSNVHLELEEADGMTVLKLHQDGVPTSEVERTRQNWNNYYWQSIKMTFGFGSFLG